MQYTYTRKSSSDPYHIYYSLNVFNYDPQSQSANPLSFIDTRSSTYLDDARKYFMSIIKFNFDTPRTLPVLRADLYMLQSGTLATQTNYQVGFTNGSSSVVYWYNILCIPENQQYNPSSLPLTPQYLYNQYYWYYSYNTVLNWINGGIAVAFLNAQANSLFTPPTLIPYISFDDNMNAQWNAIASEYDGLWKVVFNTDLMNLFSTLDYDVFNFSSPSQLLNAGYPGNQSNIGYVIQPKTLFTQNLPYTAYQVMDQTYISPIAKWTPVQSVVFTSSIIPLVTTSTSQPRIIGAKITPADLSDGNNDNVSPVITDFSLSLTAQNNWAPNLLYIPSGEYRLFDLGQSDKLNQLGMSIFWKDRLNNLFPVYLGHDCAITIDIMFRRKDFNVSV